MDLIKGVWWMVGREDSPVFIPQEIEHVSVKAVFEKADWEGVVALAVNPKVLNL